MGNARSVRYRRLALAEQDKANADLLFRLADECDRGILCTSEWLFSNRLYSNEQPRNAEEAKVRVRLYWDGYN
jgi:hypothetical protein